MGKMITWALQDWQNDFGAELLLGLCGIGRMIARAYPSNHSAPKSFCLRIVWHSQVIILPLIILLNLFTGIVGLLPGVYPGNRSPELRTRDLFYESVIYWGDGADLV